MFGVAKRMRDKGRHLSTKSRGVYDIIAAWLYHKTTERIGARHVVIMSQIKMRNLHNDVFQQNMNARIYFIFVLDSSSFAT